MKQFEDGDVANARMQLAELAERYPASKQVLYALMDMSMMSEDWYTYTYYGDQLISLESGDDRAETLNNMVFAFNQLIYPALAWSCAKEILTNHPDYEQINTARSFVEKVETFLIEQVDEIIGSTDLTKDEKLNLIVQHDWVRFYTQTGHPEESIAAARKILKKFPDMIPILNNLSLSQFILGKTEEAKETAQKALAKDPDNFHALANMVRFDVLTAQFDQARENALRLQKVTGDNPDLETKQAEAFAFLGEDEQVLTAYEQAKEKYGEAGFLVLHLAAAASYRLGDEKKAWRLWKKAVKLNPSFEMAQESLAEKSLPVAERNVPWYWPLQYWFPVDIRELLTRHLGSDQWKMNDKAVQRGMRALLEERPYFPQLFPHILEYGDHSARYFVINFIRIVETPELVQLLYDFARGPYGTDETRMDAIYYITESFPEILPEDKIVTMWVNGKQTKLLMLGFEINHEQVVVEGVSEEIHEKHETAYEFLMDDEPEAAELILKEITEEAPQFHSAYNQLAVVYQMQGQHEKARTLFEEMFNRFPDYLFARTGLARILVKDKKIKAAKDLIEPLFRQQKLHISEFRALAITQIEISLAEKQDAAARSWLELWKQFDEDNPQLLQMQELVEGPGLTKRLGSLLRG